MTIHMTKKKTKTTSLWQISFSWSFNIFCQFSVSYVMFLSCFIVFLYVFMILVCDVSSIVKCFLYFFFGFDWFVNGFVALMLENERHDWKTERQWQENDRKMTEKHDKKTQVFSKFHFPGFKIFAIFLSCFCHVWLMSLMFSWF